MNQEPLWLMPELVSFQTARLLLRFLVRSKSINSCIKVPLFKMLR